MAITNTMASYCAYTQVAPIFRIVIIVLAGVNALYFTICVCPGIAAGAKNFIELPLQAKISTSLSLLFWTSVVVLGRFIPYVEDL